MTWESAHIPPVRVEEHGLRQPESATVGVCAPEKAIFWLAAWNMLHVFQRKSRRHQQKRRARY
jgi:hypothetical protein